VTGSDRFTICMISCVRLRQYAGLSSIGSGARRMPGTLSAVDSGSMKDAMSDQELVTKNRTLFEKIVKLENKNNELEHQNEIFKTSSGPYAEKMIVLADLQRKKLELKIVQLQEDINKLENDLRTLQEVIKFK